MKPKTIITYLLIGFTTILYAQNTIKANSSWTGRLCNGGHGMCHINTTNNEATANTQLILNQDQNELTLVISKTKIDHTSKLKLTNNELETDFYLYNFDESFELPNDLLNALGITNFTKIKKGNYLVKEQGDSLIIKLKLE